MILVLFVGKLRLRWGFVREGGDRTRVIWAKSPGRRFVSFEHPIPSRACTAAHCEVFAGTAYELLGLCFVL
jgi:hypothetical protein